MGKKADRLEQEFYDFRAQSGAINEITAMRIRNLEMRVLGTPPAEEPAGAPRWSLSFPLDPYAVYGSPDQYVRQKPLAWVQSRWLGGDNYREMLAIWPWGGEGTNRTAGYLLEHKQRFGKDELWSGPRNTLAWYIAPNGEILRAELEPRVLDRNDPYYTEPVTDYEFGAIWTEQPTEFEELPELPNIPPDVQNGDVLSWWPMSTAAGSYMGFVSVIWHEAELYLSLRGPTDQPPAPGSAFKIVLGRLMFGARFDLDATESYRFGIPMLEGDWPQ